jgi:hypothetical protein
MKTEAELLAAAPPPSFIGSQTYIGTKVIHAIPMTLGDYNNFRSWTLPGEENPNAPGYLIEYADGVGEPNMPHITGYVSWTPKSVFENSYHLVVKADFFDRLQTEHTELETKLAALETYRLGEAIHTLPTNQQILLHQQAGYMREYLDTLTKRIEDIYRNRTAAGDVPASG